MYLEMLIPFNFVDKERSSRNERSHEEQLENRGTLSIKSVLLRRFYQNDFLFIQQFV